ncbi:glucan endo-1,3-beta-glucosidase 12 isoform X1 [Vigna radiata var. radiata]|uniref:Glucan endo-1,3-beta-glucosidase 12 isoform X1 n=1 Tax=Vigna radiata var. radiata TaxID=3916 RepID=A0A3Q0F808_VIGRR|nr:glucan endo-1,3-beta-glucosidase 12 isoform X1 [Vigna radiata var. radiata]
MNSPMLKVLIALLLLAVSFQAHVLLEKFSGQFEEWCIADEQTPDEELQRAMDWACENGGADCSMIKVNQPCYLPNTLKKHASYVFNSYYQRFKHKGGSCYFNSAAITTDLDPSHGSCKYELLP